jgi:hypothetical protein
MEAAAVTANGKPTETPKPINANPAKANHKSLDITKKINPMMDVITKTLATLIVPKFGIQTVTKKAS